MIKNYLQLMRLHKPIGIFLLLWPTLWALWLATAGHPNVKIVVIFILGVIVMRSAGCVINDIADRDFDKHVQRTKNRPLTAGVISLMGAWICFSILCLVALLLVLQLNWLTIYLSFGALFFACLYPFTKRFLQVPQLFLGVAFSFAIPMAFAAQTNALPFLAWVLFLLNIVWVIIYDTLYAMVDREDDLKIGIKSSAVFFGSYDKIIIALLQMAVVMGLIYVGYLAQLSLSYYFAIVLVVVLFCYQQFLIKDRNPSNCFKAFLNNNYVGLIIFFGLLVNYL